MNPEQQAAEYEAKSAERKSVVIIGLDPSLIDFSSPDFSAFPGLTAEKVLAGITAAEESLKTLGYDAKHCLIDFGQTAEAVVTAELQKHRFDCILIGAGVRTVPSNLILFEKLINIIHELAPDSRICFNTNPSDTLDALRRWI
jgi:malate/lactate dehydrogenase